MCIRWIPLPAVCGTGEKHGRRGLYTVQRCLGDLGMKRGLRSLGTSFSNTVTRGG